MTNADILKKKLRADVAAAKDKRTCDDAHGAYREGCSECEQDFPDPKAKRRIAALDGPALLERLIEEHAALEAISGPCDGPDECGVCDTIAGCADALEVPHE